MLSFTYTALREFLQHVQSKMKIMPFCEWSGGPGMILRHDVDMDIVPAHRMALIEEDVGVRSSFFILMTCETYNPASPRNRELIQEMHQRGFEIGLHFDPAVYDTGDISLLSEAMKREAGLLANIIDNDIRSVSLHNPSILGQYPLFEGYINAYDKQFFSEDRYLSDSRMVFRTAPYNFFEKAQATIMQLLLHPMHFSEKGDDYPQPMLRYLYRLSSAIDQSFSVNSTYREKVKGELFRNFQNFDPD